MIGLGTIVNVSTVLAGGLTGLLLKKVLAKRVTDTIMQGVGLAVIIIGLSGAFSASFTAVNGKITAGYSLLLILSLAGGALVGECLGIEKALDNFARYCENKLVKPGETSTFAQGFVTATLVFCVGSMSIVGALEDGINKNSTILFAKSALDGITAMIFASTMGIGVLFSAAIVLVYQGSITLFALFVAPYLGETVISQMSFVGSVLIMGIGLNLLGIVKIKVGNLLPAVFVPVVYDFVTRWFG